MKSFKEYLNEAFLKISGLVVDTVRVKNVLLPMSERSIRKKILFAVENPGSNNIIQVVYDGAVYQGNIIYNNKWTFEGVRLPKQDSSKPMNLKLKDIKYLQIPAR